MAEVMIGKHRAGGTEIVFEGRTMLTFDPNTQSLEDLEANAIALAERAAQAAYRARRAAAIVRLIKKQRAEEAEQKRLSRNAKAAATRAHNADPFGFKAAGYTD